MATKIKQVTNKEGARYYTVGGVQYPSVTTILNVIEKPALKFWYVNTALAYVKSIKPSAITKVTVGDILKAAKQKPAEASQEALDIGSEVHTILEGIVKRWFKQRSKYEVMLKEGTSGIKNEQVRNCVLAFLEWAKQVKFVPIGSELTVYSKSKGFAGTLDAAGYVHNKLAIIDFKSSKAVYPEYHLQLSAYKKAYEEMQGLKVKETWVLRLGKTDGAFEAVKVGNHRANLKAFYGAQALWQWQNAKQKTKPRVAKSKR